MNTRMYEKRKKKVRKRRLFKLLLIVGLLLLGVFGYSGYQYYQGLKEAGASNFDDNKDIEFNGQEDELGRINVLLLGIDTRGEEKSRTDTIMIAQYDPDKDEAKLVSLMRDIYVEIPGYDNYKINTAYFLGGPELLRKTIKHNFDIDVQYYALVDFKGFEKTVDALASDGVEIDVEKEMSEKIDVVLEPGLQKLNGKELLDYARFRHDGEGDFGRVRRQQQVISAIKDELMSINGVTKLPRMLGTVQPYIETNISGADRLAIAKDFILNPIDDIETLRIPLDESYTDEYYDHAGAVLQLDFDANRQALKDFLGKSVTETAQSEEDENEESK
jgi:LCP family protein required for cell wall assembly